MIYETFLGYIKDQGRYDILILNIVLTARLIDMYFSRPIFYARGSINILSKT